MKSIQIQINTFTKHGQISTYVLIFSLYIFLIDFEDVVESNKSFFRLGRR